MACGKNTNFTYRIVHSTVNHISTYEKPFMRLTTVSVHTDKSQTTSVFTSSSKQMSFTQTRHKNAWQLKRLSKLRDTTIEKKIFHADPFESQLWLRNRKRKLREDSTIADAEMKEKTFSLIQSTILFFILINNRFILFPGDEVGRLRSTDYYTSKVGCDWWISILPWGEKLFPQLSVRCCTILLFVGEILCW